MILAPGAAELGQPTHLLRLLFSGYTIFDREDLLATDQHTPDAVSFHFYGAGSQRCGESPFGHDKEDALSGRWLGQVDSAIATTTKLRDRAAPDAPLWITETAETACGGNPWAAMFTDVFRFTDQLARAARQGVQVYMHNTLSASDYGLLDETTHAPRPNYWAAWLWRNFMGTQVLDAGESSEGLHLYAHCLRDQRGGVAVLAINLDEHEKRTVRIPAVAKLFSLREGKTPAQATLNGLPLELGPEDSLPVTSGVEVQPGELALEPASVNYITFPQAGNASCG